MGIGPVLSNIHAGYSGWLSLEVCRGWFSLVYTKVCFCSGKLLTATFHLTPGPFTRWLVYFGTLFFFLRSTICSGAVVFFPHISSFFFLFFFPFFFSSFLFSSNLQNFISLGKGIIKGRLKPDVAEINCIKISSFWVWSEWLTHLEAFYSRWIANIYIYIYGR